jgi:hypothetical protein
MNVEPRTSRLAVTAFCSGLGALVCGFLALVSDADFFLLGLATGFFLAVACAMAGLWAIRRSDGILAGKGLAKWGIGLPVGGLVLGFLLLPAT